MGNYQQCPGHFGAIKIPPILNHTYAPFAASILNCICLQCNRIIFLDSYLRLAMGVDGSKTKTAPFERRAHLLKMLSKQAKKIGIA